MFLNYNANGSDCDHLEVITFGHTESGENCCLRFINWLPHVDFDLTVMNIQNTKQLLDVMIDTFETINEVVKKSKNIKYRVISRVSLLQKIPFYGYHNKHHLFARMHISNHKHINIIRKVCQDLDLKVYEGHIRYDLQFLSELKIQTIIMQEFYGTEVQHKISKCIYEYQVDTNHIIPTKEIPNHQKPFQNENVSIYWGKTPFKNYVKGDLKTKSFNDSDDLLLNKMLDTFETMHQFDSPIYDIDGINLVLKMYNVNPSRQFSYDNTICFSQQIPRIFSNYSCDENSINNDDTNKGNNSEEEEEENDINLNELDEGHEIITQELVQRNNNKLEVVFNQPETKYIQFNQNIDFNESLPLNLSESSSTTFDAEEEIIFNQLSNDDELEEGISQKQKYDMTDSSKQYNVLFSQMVNNKIQTQRKILSNPVFSTQANIMQTQKFTSQLNIQKIKSPQMSIANESPINYYQNTNSLLIDEMIQNIEKDPCDIYKGKTTNLMEIHSSIITFKPPPPLQFVEKDIKFHSLSFQNQPLHIPILNKKQNVLMKKTVMKYFIPPPTVQQVIKSLTNNQKGDIFYIDHPIQPLEPYSNFMLQKIYVPFIFDKSSICCFYLMFNQHIQTTYHYASPSTDKIEAIIIYTIKNSTCQFQLLYNECDIIQPFFNTFKQYPMKCVECYDEYDLLKKFINLINTSDPDILLSYDIQFDLQFLSTRLKSYEHQSFEDQISRFDEIFTKKNKGRLQLSMWSIYKFCSKTAHYSIQHLLKKEFNVSLTSIPYRELIQSNNRLITCFTEFHASLYLINHFHYFDRIFEFATFHSCPIREEIERGTQYKEESCLSRLCLEKGYEMFSPTQQDLAKMRATECRALVMEPQSGYHGDPIIVLDFLSMYPTTAIAYNICYSTCLGYVHDLNLKRKIGAFYGVLEKDEILKLRNHLHVTANNVVFVNADIRKGCIPIQMEEFLSTRQHVKYTSKHLDKQSSQFQIKNLQQLALKLHCNTLYGYTGASATGRMPCSDIADAIIETSRRTLERAIEIVEQQFGFEVIYADTDSLFIKAKNKTKKEAFEIAKSICTKVNSTIPAPMKLQLEKVYQPLVLISKKRYFGWKYVDEVNPGELEVKGLEVIRRDSCGAVKKMMKEVMKYLINNNVSGIQTYLKKNWDMLQNFQLNIKDFVFSKRVRSSYAPNRKLPAAAQLVQNEIDSDQSFHYQTGQRIKYIVVQTGSLRLSDNVVSPEHAIKHNMLLNIHYYVEKQINNSLQRILLPCGIDINDLFEQQKKEFFFLQPTFSHQKYIEDFYQIHKCIICSRITTGDCLVCKNCLENQSLTLASYQLHIQQLERSLFQYNNICYHCQMCYNKSCSTTECPILYPLLLLQNDYYKVKNHYLF
ncbi:DNA polymerase [Entamoeba marina]